MPESCFVIMPIGDQDGAISAEDLRSRYDDLIKEALMRANPDLDVVRADEVAAPGTITADIIRRLRDSEHVIADVTYPNPNVFYELGLRHASRLGTLIIREKNGPHAPFDVAHLRHVLYTNTPTGLKRLQADFEKYFRHRKDFPTHPDNQYQELLQASQSLTNPNDELADPRAEAFLAILQAPDLLEFALKSSASGEDIDPAEFVRAMTKNPDASSNVLRALFKSGQIHSATSAEPQGAPAGTPPANSPNRAQRRRSKS